MLSSVIERAAQIMDERRELAGTERFTVAWDGAVFAVIDHEGLALSVVTEILIKDELNRQMVWQSSGTENFISFIQSLMINNSSVFRPLVEAKLEARGHPAQLRLAR